MPIEAAGMCPQDPAHEIPMMEAAQRYFEAIRATVPPDDQCAPELDDAAALSLAIQVLLGVNPTLAKLAPAETSLLLGLTMAAIFQTMPSRLNERCTREFARGIEMGQAVLEQAPDRPVGTA